MPFLALPKLFSLQSYWGFNGDLNDFYRAQAWNFLLFCLAIFEVLLVCAHEAVIERTERAAFAWRATSVVFFVCPPSKDLLAIKCQEAYKNVDFVHKGVYHEKV